MVRRQRSSHLFAPLLLSIVFFFLLSFCSIAEGTSLESIRRAQRVKRGIVQVPILVSAPSTIDPLSQVGANSSVALFGHQSFRSSVVMSPSAGEPEGGLNANKPRRGYEVNRPPRILPERDHVRSCTVQLLEHTFENSYYNPAITTYSPALFEDEECRDPSQWVFIQLDVHGSGKGRQFDRLGSVQLDGIEILRHDNQEPSANGTVWDFSKEVSKYYDLFRKERTLLFDLPNVVNEIYTSPLHYTLSLTVYVPTKDGGNSKLRPLADDYAVILPLSLQNKTSNSFFDIGDRVHEVDESRVNRAEGITRLKFPHNARSAIVEIYASGTAQDEFWYGNIPDDDFERIGGAQANVAYSRGPLREVQLSIDGKLAGVVQPYPVVFTGGISPFLWRPQVAFGAFDQPTYLLDITPFIGTLTDDREHDFGLTVVSAEKNHTILSWFVSGNVQVQLDSSDKRTTGGLLLHVAPSAGDYTVFGYEEGNITQDGKLHVDVRTAIPRVIRIEGEYQLGSSLLPSAAVVTQSLTYSNVNDLTANTSSTVQHAQGSYLSQHNFVPFLSYHFSYPFTTTAHEKTTTVDHGYHVEVEMSSDASSTFKEPHKQKIDVTQQCEAVSIIEGNPPTLIGGSGSSFISYSYEDSNGYTFQRDNKVVNQTVTHDEVHGTLASQAGPIE